MRQLTLLAVLAGSLLCGVVCRLVFDRFGWLLGAERAGALFEAFALKVLLPLFVYEALTSAGLSLQSMSVVLAGATLPLSCLLVAGWVARRRSAGVGGAPHAREIAFLAASFGGGNRGTAMLLLAFAGAADFNAYLQAFVLVDLGNFLILLLVVPELLTRFLGERNSGMTTTWWRVASRSYFATGFVLVLACYFVGAQWNGWDSWLGQTAGVRKTAFSVLVFFALGIRIQLQAPDALRSLPRDLALFLVVRGVAAVAVLSGMWLLDMSVYAITATGVLFAMPPSSLLPVLATRAGVRPESLSYLAGFSAVCNLFYLFALAAAGLAVWISQAGQASRL